MSSPPPEEKAQDMAPWAHPKAQAWFKTLFNRSQFGFMMEDVIKQPVDSIHRDQMRAILTFAVLLGRQEIWPEEQQMVLKLILEKARAISTHNSNTQTKLTLSQHRSRQHNKCEFGNEIEILRRRLGRSFKTNPLNTPSTWHHFWT